jgi:hypothetical protein
MLVQSLSANSVLHTNLTQYIAFWYHLTETGNCRIVSLNTTEKITRSSGLISILSILTNIHNVDYWRAASVRCQRGDVKVGQGAYLILRHAI